MLQEKMVRRFKKKCGELAEKLPIATTAPIKSFRSDDSSPRSIVRSPVSKSTRPLPALAWKMALKQIQEKSEQKIANIFQSKTDRKILTCVQGVPYCARKLNV
jgi:hypothetical protein